MTSRQAILIEAVEGGARCSSAIGSSRSRPQTSPTSFECEHLTRLDLAAARNEIARLATRRAEAELV